MLQFSDAGYAQVSTFIPGVIYTLLPESQLLKDCPICDFISAPVPMSGSFRLRTLDNGPFSSRYEMTDISFRAGDKTGVQFQVSGGNGIYKKSGELVAFQEMVMSVLIDDGFSKTVCLCANTDLFATTQWPSIRVNMLQTNGTISVNYQLTIVAAPVPQITSMAMDASTGSVRLEWLSDRKVQLERAEKVEGPYSVISPITTELSFTDLSPLTNGTGAYYRFRQY